MDDGAICENEIKFLPFARKSNATLKEHKKKIR